MALIAEPRVIFRNRLILLALWLVFYCSFTLFAPPLLDDADSVHAEVAREMLARHDFVTLYANGIRYLEKAPLYYWAEAASISLFGTNTAATRVPLAFAVLVLALLLEAFARAFASQRAGLYAGLITLSSFGIFIFSRINIPDVLVCVLLATAIFCYAQTGRQPVPSRALCLLFAAACALNILTKGLIGIVFPAGITGFHLLLTRGWRGAWTRLRRFHPLASLATFLIIAVPWHILVALANPGHGHPGGLTRIDGHWQVPYPTDGNVHGWAWFYFINEQLYRYLNIRVPHDYDTSPLWLFLGLIFIWLMPWSAFLPSAIFRVARSLRISTLRALAPIESLNLLLLLWLALPLAFFSFSTRQEYYVLPALPPMILLIAALLESGTLAKPVNNIDPVLQMMEAYTVEEVQEAMLDELEQLRNAGKVTSNLYDQFRSGARSASPPFSTGSSRVRSRDRYASDGSPYRPDQPEREGSRTVGIGVASTALLFLDTALSIALTIFLLKTKSPAPNADLAALLQQNPTDYALSFGHFLDLNAQALGLFRLPLAVTAIAFFFGPLAHWLLRRRHQPHAATLTLAAASFVFLLAAWQGLRIFSPTLTSAQLADSIRPQLHPGDLIAIHGEYEAGSTLGFYLRRNDIHIIEGRSSNLWYGSFFPDAPPIFETRESIASKWLGPQRIFLWQDPHDEDRPILQLPQPVYVIVDNGGKQILSNRPTAQPCKIVSGVPLPSGTAFDLTLIPQLLLGYLGMPRRYHANCSPPASPSATVATPTSTGCRSCSTGDQPSCGEELSRHDRWCIPSRLVSIIER